MRCRWARASRRRGAEDADRAWPCGRCPGRGPRDLARRTRRVPRGLEARAGWGKDLPDWLRNARWNFGSFTPDKAPRSGANQAICLACHKRQAVVGYVYTFNELRDAAHAR